MAVVYDNASYSGLTPAGPSFFNWAHTCGTGLNRLLVVFVESKESASITISSVTYNGVAMTLVRGEAISASPPERVALYQLVNPASGSNTVQVNLSGNQTQDNAVNAGAISFSGANQINPIRATVAQIYNPGTEGTDFDIEVSSRNGDYVIAGLRTPGIVSTTNGTSRWDEAAYGGYNRGLTKVATGNPTGAGWTITTAQVGVVIVASIQSHIEGSAPFFYMAGGDY